MLWVMWNLYFFLNSVICRGVVLNKCWEGGKTSLIYWNK